MVLRVYGDNLSQPTRSVLVFVRATNIEHDVREVVLSKAEHKKPEYLAVHPMGQVPAIDDDGFKLFESHAILRYLAVTRSVPDHWYPADPKRRARVECILDWHHVNLREGSRKFVFNKVIAKTRGLEPDEKAAHYGEKVLNASLIFIENNWLTGEAPFLDGAPKPSIADLSLVCEVKQLELLDRADQEAILGPRGRIIKWVQATEKCLAPHFAGVHSHLKIARDKAQAARDAEKIQSTIYKSHSIA